MYILQRRVLKPCLTPGIRVVPSAIATATISYMLADLGLWVKEKIKNGTEIY